MKALPFILGGGAVLLVVAAAAKAKASTSSSSTTKPSSSATKPTTTTPAVIVGPAGIAPEYLSSVPYVIAMRVIQLSDPSLQQAQGVWLTDNGYPQTGEAVQQYSKGEITDVQLRQIAQAEFKTAATASTTTAKPKGTTAPDTYGTYLLNAGDDDTLYSYALTSLSIPFVAQAAARLAAGGDTRAAALTQHLADIST
jgi:hypothetical protein